LSGHGTYMASVAIGTNYGVASAANAIAVKISDGFPIRSAAVIGACDWVMHAASTSRKPSVANMSFHVKKNDAMEQAVKAVIEAGIHVTASAGNKHINACDSLPGRSELL
jgi:cerevisin